MSPVDKATERIRSGLHINPTYSDVASIGNGANQENETLQPLRAVFGHQTRPTSQKRFKSSIEIGRGRKRPPRSQPNEDNCMTTNTLPMAPLANTGKRSKTCSMCYQKGHTVRHCPSLEPYKGIPLAKDDIDGRSQLSISLAQSNLYATRSLPNTTTTYKSLPHAVQALILHNRVLVCNRYCFECTILHEGGMEHERYTKKPFELGCIAKYITKSKQNIIISELRLLVATSASSTNADLFDMSQLSQHSVMSQPFWNYHQMNNNDTCNGNSNI